MRCIFLQSRLLNSCRHAQQWRPNQVQHYLHRFKDKMAIPAGCNVVVTASDLELGSKSLMKRPVEVKHRRFLCSGRACSNLVLLLAVAAIVVCTCFKPTPESKTILSHWLPISCNQYFLLQYLIWLNSSKELAEMCSRPINADSPHSSTATVALATCDATERPEHGNP